MSSDRPSDAPSPGPDPPDPEPGLAALLQSRGAPLIEALEGHLPGAREHAEATASYTFATAVELGFGRERCEIAREAAKLHEVGQLYVPTAVLARPAGERDAAQAVAFDSHHEAGYRLARGAGIPEHACGWLLRVRERYDGRGPERLAAEAIPIESRIIRAACVCETALAEPAGAGGPPQRHAVERLSTRAAGELDPRVVATLIAVLDRAARTPGLRK